MITHLKTNFSNSVPPNAKSYHFKYLNETRDNKNVVDTTSTRVIVINMLYH